MTMTVQKQIKVSERAYYTLKAKSKTDEFKGRGVTGVVDQMLFGEFTTKGSGRPFGTVLKKKRKKS